MTNATEQPPGDELRALPMGMIWAVKRSFVDYVRGMSDGRCLVDGGALPFGDSQVYFPLDASDADGWRFRGRAAFVGHFGFLKVPLAEPAITVADGRATVTIVDPFSSEAGARLNLVHTPLALIKVEDGVEHWYGADVRLAETGVELFNEVYAAGEEFDPVMLLVPAPVRP